MMGVSGCMSVRQARGACHCPACPRASGHGAPMPPPSLALPPMALPEPETTPVKDKKGSKMKVLKKIKKKMGLVVPAKCTSARGSAGSWERLARSAFRGSSCAIDFQCGPGFVLRNAPRLSK
ncbi:unnamed protein product, partial [Iphiclides podalirius]